MPFSKWNSTVYKHNLTNLGVSEMDGRKKLADYQGLNTEFPAVFSKKNQTCSSSGPKCAICMDVVNL